MMDEWSTCLFTRAKETIAIQVDYMRRLFGDPDFCIPSKVVAELLVGLEIGKCCHIDITCIDVSG